jgi:hypothetical protein
MARSMPQSSVTHGRPPGERGAYRRVCGPDRRYLAYGRTEHGRWMFVVYVTRPRGRVRVLTARDMTERERRLYQRERRGRS